MAIFHNKITKTLVTFDTNAECLSQRTLDQIGTDIADYLTDNYS